MEPVVVRASSPLSVNYTRFYSAFDTQLAYFFKVSVRGHIDRRASSVQGGAERLLILHAVDRHGNDPGHRDLAAVHRKVGGEVRQLLSAQIHAHYSASCVIIFPWMKKRYKTMVLRLPVSRKVDLPPLLTSALMINWNSSAITHLCSYVNKCVHYWQHDSRWGQKWVSS